MCNSHPFLFWWSHSFSGNCMCKCRWCFWRIRCRWNKTDKHHEHSFIRRDTRFRRKYERWSKTKKRTNKKSKFNCVTYNDASWKYLTTATGTFLRNDACNPGGHRFSSYTSPGHQTLPNFTQTMSPSLYANGVCSHILLSSVQLCLYVCVCFVYFGCRCLRFTRLSIAMFDRYFVQLRCAHASHSIHHVALNDVADAALQMARKQTHARTHAHAHVSSWQ